MMIIILPPLISIRFSGPPRQSGSTLLHVKTQKENTAEKALGPHQTLILLASLFLKDLEQYHMAKTPTFMQHAWIMILKPYFGDQRDKIVNS